MKRILALLLMVVSISIANAQQRERGQGPRGGSPEQRVEAQTERLVKQLELSEEQKTAVHTILVEQSKKQRELFAQQRDGDREQLRKQRTTLFEETDGKIKALLNEEQKLKYEQVKAERSKRVPNRHRPAGRGRADRGVDESR